MIGRFLLVTAFVVGSVCAASSVQAVSTYDTAVLADGPVLFHCSDDGTDCSSNGRTGTLFNTPTSTTMPNGDAAPVFDGVSEYVQVADHDSLSVPTTGVLTIEAWIRPDTLEFPNDQSSGYVHWMGKGGSGQAEWVSRMYSYTNTENRPNRISGYAFNITGGLGTGGYWQDPVSVGEWIHYTFTINKNATSPTYPDGTGKIWKNGVLRRTENLDYGGTPINPGNGTHPFRIGTRDFGSYFQGSVAKVAIYDYELTTAEIAAHTAAM